MSLRTLLALSLLVSTACRDQLNPPTPGPTPQGGATGAGGRRPASGGASGSTAQGGSGGASGAGGIAVPGDASAGGSSADGAMGGLNPTGVDAALNPAIDGAVDATPAPEVGPAGQALFIIGPQVPAGGDIPVHERLAARLSVEVMRSVTVDRQALMNRALVVISATAAPNALDNLALEDLPVPILVLEPNLLPVLEMTGSFQSDFGATPNNERDLDLVGRNHPLHAGLSGRVTVYDDFSRMTWGDPGQQAIRIATPASRSWQTAIFAYPTGTWMVGRRAPAPRVAFFIHGNSVQTLAPDGAKLLDAAIDWLIRPE